MAQSGSTLFEPVAVIETPAGTEKRSVHDFRGTPIKRPATIHEDSPKHQDALPPLTRAEGNRKMALVLANTLILHR